MSNYSHIEFKYSFLMSIYHKETIENFMMSFDSMVKQTLPPDEIVLIYDGNVNSAIIKYVDNFIKRNKRIKILILKNKTNMGLGYSLDKGIKMARNEFIARMDSDDISLKNRIKKQSKLFLDNPDLVLSGGQVAEFSDDPKEIKSYRIVPTNEKKIRKFLIYRSPFNHPTVIFRKSIVTKLGGYGKYKFKQDYELFSKIISSNYAVSNHKDVVLLFRSNINNFKRRKSSKYVFAYIQIAIRNFKRKLIKFHELLLIILMQFILLITPMFIFVYVNKKILRKKNE